MSGGPRAPAAAWAARTALLLLACLAPTAGPGGVRAQTRWQELPPLPDEVGFAGGFAGVSGGALVFAGGANFAPPVWDADKEWSDRVFVLPDPEAAWREVGRLPEPRAYGASVAFGDEMVCIGGDDADEASADVFALRWDGEAFALRDLPPLPRARVHHGAARVGAHVYVVGGQLGKALDDATASCLRLDLTDPDGGWEELPPLPGGPRALLFVQAQHDGHGTRLYAFGGRRSAPDGPFGLEFLQDHWQFDPGAADGAGAWSRRAAPPVPLMAGCAVPVGQSHLAVLSYADGSILRAIEASGETERTFDHPGFPRPLYAYHTITDTWKSFGELPPGVPNQVTTTAVPQWRGLGAVVPSGEVQPRVRTPRVHRVVFEARPRRFGSIDLGVLVLYLAAMVGVGLWHARANENTDDYFRGGQHMPFWAVGCSIYATMLSSLTYVGLPALVFATDWLLAPGVLMIVAAAPIAITVAMPFFRRIDATSAYEYFGRRFGPSARRLGSGLFTLFHVSRMGIVMALTALALSAVTGIEPWVSVLLMGVLCLVYCTLGGIQAVIWTDTAQTLVLLGGAVACLVAVVAGLDGGWSELFSTGAEAGKFRFVDLDFGFDSASKLALWVVILGGLGQNLSSYTADQAVVQRYVTTRDAREAARSIWMNGLMAVPGSALFFLLGTGLWVFYRNHPERLDPTLQNDQVLPVFIGAELPTGLAGLLVAGIFAAAQSTVSTSMNSTATTVVTDFLGGRADGGRAPSLRLARNTTIVMGVLGTAAGLLFISPAIRSLMSEYFKVIGMFMGALGGLFLLGVTSRRAHGRGALLGLLVGVATMVAVWRTTTVDGYLYAAVGVAVTWTVGLGLSLVLPAGAEDGEVDGLTLRGRGMGAE